MKLLEIEHLSKTYRLGEVEVRALQDVSITIEQGEFVAIMGASGSGKSTLMHLLGFLDSPDAGTIKLLGRDVSKLTEDEYASLRNRTIGFIFQQFNLMARSTALENVSLPLLYSSSGKASGNPLDLLKQVGLEDRVNHKPTELSGGQQQRVAIARALVNHPPVILADEPTGNLDSKSGKEIMDIFKAMHAKGMTVILVTHDEKIGEAAGRVIRMQDGKVIQDEKREAPVRSAKPPVLDHEPRKKYTKEEFKEHFHQASRMIRSNKLRSFLSLLGVLIGVACVVTMLALGRGAKEAITEQLARLGSNLISVRPGSIKVRGVAQDAALATRLSFDDVRFIRETVPSVKDIAPQVSGPGQLVYGDKNWSTMIIGTAPEYAAMKNVEPATGRFFTDQENMKRQRVVLLGLTVARELFGTENPVGHSIKVNRINFQVIGILPSQGSNSFRDQDDVIIMPLLTAMYRVMGKQFLDQIEIEIASADEVLPAQEEIRALIIKRHRLTPERYDSFNIRNYADVRAAMESTTQTFSVLLGCVAVISLVVGGIGIMNIMLVSVKERTREIGLRKAIGAAPHDILMQFLIESIAITFLGGLIGILLSVGVSWLITILLKWKTVISIGSVLLAFIFSVVVGVVFGLWPARQAAKLDPILALRYE